MVVVVAISTGTSGLSSYSYHECMVVVFTRVTIGLIIFEELKISLKFVKFFTAGSDKMCDRFEDTSSVIQTIGSYNMLT